MVRGVVSRQLFIDSSVNTHFDRTKLNLPPHPFSAVGTERISLSLQQFAIRKQWYNVNATNNVGYIYIDSTYHEFIIAPGTYASFNALARALQDALNVEAAKIAEINEFAVAYTEATRKFEIDVSMTSRQDETYEKVELRCFAVKNGALPAGVSSRGGFSDLHELLGGKPLTSGTDDFESLETHDGGSEDQNIVSFFPACLDTLPAIFIHLVAFETGNYMSTGLERNLQDDFRLVESSLFARIPTSPANQSIFANEHEMIEFMDPGSDMFQAFPMRKNMEQLELRICDGKGRSLSALDPDNTEHGFRWQGVIRFDLFKPQAIRTGKPVGSIITNHPPEL